MRWQQLRALGAAVVVVGSSGCGGTVVRHPARTPVIALTSPTSFRLLALDSAQAGCDVKRADIQITAVRGDTVFFASATSRKWPYAAPRCTVVGPGFVTAADHPDLRTDRLRRPSRLLSVTIGVLASVSVLAVAVSFLSLGGGS